MSDNKGLHKGVAKANICNHTDELNGLIGLKIVGVKACESDYGFDFLMLETDQTFENGKPVHLIVSQDAELNGGGYLGYADVSNEENWTIIKGNSKKRGW
tara:strand:+ start:115 stop:414 length:300 start_codon:yes stop_codon:yes gene_type:complete